MAAIPFFLWGSKLMAIGREALLIGVLAGTANGLGTWFLFTAFERNAKASVAVPLTALYPLITVVLAYLFLSERLAALDWVGVALALVAGAMLSCETQ
jgi:uncharacterized membrane protein